MVKEGKREKERGGERGRETEREDREREIGPKPLPIPYIVH